MYQGWFGPRAVRWAQQTSSDQKQQSAKMALGVSGVALLLIGVIFGYLAVVIALLIAIGPLTVLAIAWAVLMQQALDHRRFTIWVGIDPMEQPVVAKTAAEAALASLANQIASLATWERDNPETDASFVAAMTSYQMNSRLVTRIFGGEPRPWREMVTFLPYTVASYPSETISAAS